MSAMGYPHRIKNKTGVALSSNDVQHIEKFSGSFWRIKVAAQFYFHALHSFLKLSLNQTKTKTTENL